MRYIIVYTGNHSINRQMRLYQQDYPNLNFKPEASKLYSDSTTYYFVNRGNFMSAVALDANELHIPVNTQIEDNEAIAFLRTRVRKNEQA